MKKAVFLTGLATLALLSAGSVNNAKAEPRGANYSQQPQHQQTRHHARNDHDYNQLTRRERRHYNNRSHNRFSYRGGINYSSHYGYRGSHGYNRRHHRGDNLVLGIGLGLLTYQIINPPQPRQRVVYVERPPVTYVRTRPMQTSCLQEREYQTTVIIGGVERGAYGTACLQPDGSWKQGPAIVEPQY